MIIIIQGVTGSGKSKLAHELALQWNAEIISADSRQIYRFANIGTNKEIFADVPTHLIDIRNPDELYNAFEFKEDALAIIDQLQEKNKHVIIVGGTSFYIDVLTGRRPVHLLDADYKAHENQIQITYGTKSLTHIQSALEQNSKQVYASLNNSELHNKQRLIRKIAQATYTKKLAVDTHILSQETVKIGIDVDRLSLKTDIAIRTKEMIASGLEGEVRDIAERFGSNCTILKTIGYMEWEPYLQEKEITAAQIQEIEKEITRNTMQYVKRQITWLKKDHEIMWFEKRNDLSNKVISEVIKKVNR